MGARKSNSCGVYFTHGHDARIPTATCSLEHAGSSFSCRCSGPQASPGLTKVVNFITIVDPWRYPHDDSPGSLKVNSCVQSVVAQAVHTGNTLIKFTDASITDYLLSRHLVKKGDRPPNILKPREQQSTTTPRTCITAAATVMRKPCSPPVDVSTNQGDLFLNLPTALRKESFSL